MANDILAALASFCTCLCMRHLFGSLSSCLIILCNDVRASVITGVTGVIGVYGTWSCGPNTTLSAFGTVSLVGGFGVCRSTRSRLNGNKPVAAYPAAIFLLVNALSLAGLYKEVKCSLPTMSIPPRFSRSTSSQ